jgi:HEAT repeat protein
MCHQKNNRRHLTGEKMEVFNKSTLLDLIEQSNEVRLNKYEVDFLNSMSSEKVLPVLESQFLSTSNSIKKSWIFDAILSIQNFDKVGFLIRMLELLSQDWKYACCRRLSKFNDSRAVHELCKILVESDDPDLRFIAAESLAEIGDEVSIITLQKTVENDKGVDYETFPISGAAQKAIDRIKERLNLS